MLKHLSPDAAIEKRTSVFREQDSTTDNVQGQISEHFLKSNGGNCVYYLLDIF